MKTLNELVNKAKREIMEVDESELENLGELQKMVEKYMRETASATIEAVRPEETMDQEPAEIMKTKFCENLEFAQRAIAWLGTQKGEMTIQEAKVRREAELDAVWEKRHAEMDALYAKWDAELNAVKTKWDAIEKEAVR